jgi:hypothetical protein
MALIYHYTDKDGFSGVRSAYPSWRFAVSDPPPEYHPAGAYFTNLLPSNRQLAKKLRIPVRKTEFCFEFLDAGDLRPLPGGRGEFVFYSPKEYLVTRDRQMYNGERERWKEEAA